MIDAYILDGHTAVRVDDLIDWAKWSSVNDHHVAQSTIDTAWVSTVFLGIDHSFLCDGPILFETMVFDVDPELDRQQVRCATWEQAEVMHREMCALVYKRKLPLVLTGIFAPAAILIVVLSALSLLA